MEENAPNQFNGYTTVTLSIKLSSSHSFPTLSFRYLLRPMIRAVSPLPTHILNSITHLGYIILMVDSLSPVGPVCAEFADLAWGPEQEPYAFESKTPEV